MDEHPLSVYPYTHMDRFMKAEHVGLDATKENLVKDLGLTEEQAEEEIEKAKQYEVYLNDQYQVNVRRGVWHGFGNGISMWHLSIKRIDKAPIHDWRDLMAIKNDIVGPEFEAVELYPSIKRIVDSANQYHLWAFHKDEEGRIPLIPLGFTETLTDNGDPDGSGKLSNTKQRPYQEVEDGS